MSGPFSYPLIGRNTPEVATYGFARLSGGAVTVENTIVTQFSDIYLTYQGTMVEPGYLYIDNIIPGVSFTIMSTNTAGGDASLVGWFFIYESTIVNSLCRLFSMPLLCSDPSSPTFGQVQLSGGSATVLTAAANENYPIMLTVQTQSTNPVTNAHHTISSVTNGTSFTITSADSNDNAVMNYFAIYPSDGSPLFNAGTHVSLPLLNGPSYYNNSGLASATYGRGNFGGGGAGNDFAIIDTTRAGFNDILIMTPNAPASDPLGTREPFVFGFDPGVSITVRNINPSYSGFTNYPFSWILISPSSLG